MQQICDDLHAEYLVLAGLVRDLTEEQWDTPTPAEGWSIRDQISHVAQFDDKSRLTLVDPDTFVAERTAILESGDIEALMDEHLEKGRRMSGAQLMTWWDGSHAALVEAYAPIDPRTRVQWYGPEMGARSKITACLMEYWAHGQDVADALGVRREPTDRLRHVCHIGVRARSFSYVARGLQAPTAEVRVALTSPSGDDWTWGDEGAEHSVRGPALDFALLVTQRRHRDDLALVAEGDAADEWLSIAQAFAGPPGEGRRPGQFD